MTSAVSPTNKPVRRSYTTPGPVRQFVSTLTLTIGTDGGAVDVIVGVTGVSTTVTVIKSVDVGSWVSTIPCVRAKAVTVASISGEGVRVGVMAGKLHANAETSSMAHRNIKPLFFFTLASFTSEENYSYRIKVISFSIA